VKTQPVAQPFSLNPYPFQRSVTKFRRVNRKTRLTIKHILLLFALAGSLIYLSSRLYLFLITWEELRVKEVRVMATKELVKQELTKNLSSLCRNNIFRLNLKTVESLSLTHRWVKRVRVRKIFPSALEVIVEERQPLAVVKTTSNNYLIDEEGVILETLSGESNLNLPCIFSAKESAHFSLEELALVRECLKALGEAANSNAKLFIFSNPANLILQFEGSPTRLILGQEQFQEKLHLYHLHRSWLEANYGPLEYVDLRFYEDRVYFKPMEPSAGATPEGSPKEEN